MLIKGVISTEVERTTSQHIEIKGFSTSLKMTNRIKYHSSVFF